MTASLADAPADLPRTLGALRASGHEHRTVKEEIRANLLARMRGATTPSRASSASTTPCCPELERALLAGHDLVLLGERGQGKTRLIRTLVGLLDEWTPGHRRLRDQRAPVRAGHAVRCRRLVAEQGDATAGRVAAPRATATARSSRRPTPASAT